MLLRQAVIACVCALGAVGQAAAELTVSTSAELGYRYDSLDWNIAGNTSGSNPNILSELQWTSMDIPQATVRLELAFNEWRWFARASVGKVVEGDNQDSDYLGDNRTFEFSRSNNQAGGHVADLHGGVGYRIERLQPYKIQPYTKRHYVMPMVGAFYSKQKLRMTDAVQTISVPPDQTQPLGPFSGLNSVYDTDWWGIWGGISFIQERERRNSRVALDLKLFYGDYYAVADWNLRGDFKHPKSYDHEADAMGASFALTGRRDFSQPLYLAWSVDYIFMRATDGVDTIFKADNTIEKTRLNEVNWESWSANLGFGMDF